MVELLSTHNDHNGVFFHWGWGLRAGAKYFRPFQAQSFLHRQLHVTKHDPSFLDTVHVAPLHAATHQTSHKGRGLSNPFAGTPPCRSFLLPLSLVHCKPTCLHLLATDISSSFSTRYSTLCNIASHKARPKAFAKALNLATAVPRPFKPSCFICNPSLLSRGHVLAFLSARLQLCS